MMKLIKNPTRDDWKSITARPDNDTASLSARVGEILKDVKENGDDAVKKYELMFDKAALDSLAVSRDEFAEAERLVSDELHDALTLAHDNIEKFHKAQLRDSVKTETSKGITCWQRSVPIEKVGLYVPGGTAPLFSTVLMLATPARIAGCKTIVMCTPPGSNGKINPAILVAAKIAGVDKIYKAGGVQAIGAMAYGTGSVEKVYKIFGPGNPYVMEAKQQVSLHDVAIDMPAGPSEVCVIADATSNPVFVAADLLSQAEHGVDSQVILICTDESMIGKVEGEIERQLQLLPRRDIAAKALGNSKSILVSSTDEAMALSNAYAPEHLILACENAMALSEKVVNAGSVFIGKYACESAGDYASGTNHTLPTHGYATAYSGVNLDSFMRKITFQHITADGINAIGKAVETMAASEHLDAHKNAMTVRMDYIKGM